MNGKALRAQLEARAGTLGLIRTFFAARGVLEVATPSLSPAAATDPALTSLACEVRSLGGRYFLHTSPEHAMKRLLCAGSGDIWQLARVYRDGELGRWHQPEFELLEWYRIGYTEFDLMDEVHALLAQLFQQRGNKIGRLDIAYGDAFSDAFAIDPHSLDSAAELRLAAAMTEAGTDVPGSVGGTALLDLALTSTIVPSWPSDTVVFLYDYPLAQAALAVSKPGPPPVAARFEVFVNGLELGNGYRELGDASEQRRRFESDLRHRRATGLAEVPIDHDLLDALAKGLPDCSGIAMGLERLLAALSGREDLEAVVPLAHDVR